MKWVGGAYLVWLGIQVWRSPAIGIEIRGSAKPRASWSLFRQGALSALTNPKGLLFFTAFLPRFIDPARSLLVQTAQNMRFHLPAFLIAALISGAYLQDLCCQLACLNDYSIGQYALLSPPQRAPVRAYLSFVLEDESCAFSHPQIARALNEYWTL